MRTKKHRRGRCFLLAMPYSVCYDGKNTKRGENIMRKRCIALLLCLLTLAALTGCGESSRQSSDLQRCGMLPRGRRVLSGSIRRTAADRGGDHGAAGQRGHRGDGGDCEHRAGRAAAAEGTAAGQRGYRQSGRGDHAAARQQPAPRLGGRAAVSAGRGLCGKRAHRSAFQQQLLRLCRHSAGRTVLCI